MSKEKIPVVDDDAFLVNDVDLLMKDKMLPIQNGLETDISLKQITPVSLYLKITSFIDNTGDLPDSANDSEEITVLHKPPEMSKMESGINGAQAIKNEANKKEPSATDDIKTSILVVEDDEILQQILCDLLELKKGYAVSAAGTGKDALSRAEKTFYNVALVDLTLPDIEGLELLRELKKMCPKTQCIVLTGKVSEDFASTAMGEIAFAYLIKPSSADEILNTVEKALGI